MQFTTRSLFGFTLACALLTGYVALPTDFKEFIFVLALLFAGVGSCFYMAIAPHLERSRVTAFLIAWTLAFIVVALLGPLRSLFFNG
jgi:predicted membrane protein